jgi:hypothetical protein
MPRRVSLITSFSIVVLLILLAREVNFLIPEPALENQDIYFSYVEGKRLREEKNPYARILEGDMRENQKYATYFPVFYELSYVSQKLGLQSYLKWIAFWKTVFILFEFAIAFLLYAVLARRNLEWIGVFAAAFWLFNRWTLKVVEMSNLDFIPIFLLVLSLELFPAKKWTSLFLFSLSLGFKQIAIFLAPLYLIWVFCQAGNDRWKQTLKAGLMIASVPLVSALPFLFWNAEGFIKSILFSATRFASNQFEIPSLDVITGWEGLPARLPMIALMLMVYAFAFMGKGQKYTAAILVMSVFLDFNSVLYSQYPAWLVPLVPLIFLDFDDTINPVEPINDSN